MLLMEPLEHKMLLNPLLCPRFPQVSRISPLALY